MPVINITAMPVTKSGVLINALVLIVPFIMTVIRSSLIAMPVIKSIVTVMRNITMPVIKSIVTVMRNITMSVIKSIVTVMRNIMRSMPVLISTLRPNGLSISKG